MACLITGAVHYHAQFELSDKGHAIKVLVICLQWLRSRAFEPAKRSGLRLLLSVP